MANAAAFFSTSGRTPRLRLGLVLMLAGITMWACAPAWEGESLPLFFGAGALLGFALTKTWSEIARRIHDIGSDASVGALVLLAWGLASGAAHIAAMAQDGPWVRATDGLALGALAVLLVWPGQRGANRFGDPAHAPWLASPALKHPDSTRWLVPLLGIGGTEAVLLTLALLSHGIATSNDRTMEYVKRSAADHQRALATGSDNHSSDNRP